MHYFLDGYNILFLLEGEPQPLKKARDSLLADLADRAADRNHPITVVFDAGNALGGVSRVGSRNFEVIYSPEGQDADAYLIEVLEHYPTPGRATLVTSDRYLTRRARELGVKVLAVPAFLALIREWGVTEPADEKHAGRNNPRLFDHYLEAFERPLEEDEEDLSL